MADEEKEVPEQSGTQPEPEPPEDDSQKELTDQPPHLKHMRDILDVLRKLGQVINTATLYGSQHKLTDQAADSAFGALELLLEQCPRINLSVTEDSVLVEGSPTDKTNPFISMLAGKLNELKIAGFSLLKGMPEEEFRSLIEILVAPNVGMDGDDFAEALAERNMSFIQPEKVKYERVTEEEKVVHKDDLEDEEDEGPLVQQILAFLKGDVSQPGAKAGEKLEEMSSDAESLANLIMEAAAVRQAATAVGSGESLANIVIGCLRRTFKGLMQQPSSNTKKGRKNIKKSLLLLEKTILDKLHQITGEADAELDAAIDAAVEEMTDEVEIEDLTSDYIKKREAYKKTEKRMVRYLKNHDPEQLETVGIEDRLTDGGLNESDWQELLVQGGLEQVEDEMKKAPVPLQGGDVAGGLGALAALLSELDRMMEASESEPQTLKQKVAEVGQGVEDLSGSTGKKMDALQDKIKEAEDVLDEIDEAHKDKVKMSRAAMMELLAEIVQELCQSLSAINCAIGMTRAGHIGDINTEQDEVLGVAQKCGQRLDELLNRLIEIVGLPKGLEPDKESVYKPGSIHL